jgi:hypothetical protein
MHIFKNLLAKFFWQAIQADAIIVTCPDTQNSEQLTLSVESVLRVPYGPNTTLRPLLLPLGYGFPDDKAPCMCFYLRLLFAPCRFVN